MGVLGQTRKVWVKYAMDKNNIRYIHYRKYKTKSKLQLELLRFFFFFNLLMKQKIRQYLFGKNLTSIETEMLGIKKYIYIQSNFHN